MSSIQAGGKIEVIKGMLDKTPFKPIKIFFKVNLNSHGANFTFGSSHRVYAILGNNDVVASLSTQNKASLEEMNKVTEVRFKPAQ